MLAISLLSSKFRTICSFVLLFFLDNSCLFALTFFLYDILFTVVYFHCISNTTFCFYTLHLIQIAHVKVLVNRSMRHGTETTIPGRSVSFLFCASIVVHIIVTNAMAVIMNCCKLLYIILHLNKMVRKSRLSSRHCTHI